MVKLIGINKINTSVFISGKGTNLKNLIKFSKKREIIHLLKVLELNNIRLICLAGFLKILSKLSLYCCECTLILGAAPLPPSDFE